MRAPSEELAARSRVAYRHHLVDLTGRLEAAAARLQTAGAPARAALAEQARTETARLTVRLDASPLTDETARAVDRGKAGTVPAEALDRRGDGGWAQALKLDGLPTQELAAIEYANALAAVDAEPTLAARLFAEPVDTLAEAHRLLTAGLVAPERAGTLRRTDQAVHDGAQGQVVFALPEPAALPERLDALGAWLGGASAAVPTPIAAGILHETLLEWQPFEGAGGRLARAASRLLLRARGLDPDGVIVTDRRGADDPLGYHRQVAATIRRRGDLTEWLEWWLEGVVDAAEDAADRSHGRRPALPQRLAAWLAAAGDRVTAAEYAVAVGCDVEAARAELRAGQRAGALEQEPGTRGLRWRVQQTAPPTT